MVAVARATNIILKVHNMNGMQVTFLHTVEMILLKMSIWNGQLR